jgi:hypothetical protein
VRWIGQRAVLAMAAGALSLAGAMDPARADPGPSIEHQPLTAAVANRSVEIRTRILSNTRFPVYRASLYLRLPGLPNFNRIPLDPVAGIPDVYAALVPAEWVTGSFDYYLEAFDRDGNGPSRVANADVPLHVSVTSAPSAAPAQPTKPDPPPINSSFPTQPVGGLTSSSNAPTASASSRTGTYSAFAVGGAGVIASSVLGLLSLAKYNDAKREGPAGEQAAFSQDTSTSNVEAGLAWGALAVGLVGGALGTYWLITEPSQPAKAP